MWLWHGPRLYLMTNSLLFHSALCGRCRHWQPAWLSTETDNHVLTICWHEWYLPPGKHTKPPWGTLQQCQHPGQLREPLQSDQHLLPSRAWGVLQICVDLCRFLLFSSVFISLNFYRQWLKFVTLATGMLFVSYKWTVRTLIFMKINWLQKIQLKIKQKIQNRPFHRSVC